MPPSSPLPSPTVSPDAQPIASPPAQRLLALDTSTDSLSLAVQHGDEVFTHTGPGGAQSSAQLIPALRTLLAEAGLQLDDVDAIVFGRGPGSFTGLRTACAVAQGLAFGARGGQGLPVLAVDTLLAVAEEARHRYGCQQVVAALDARMGEVYAGAYRWLGQAQTSPSWQGPADFSLCAPEALPVPPGWAIAGNAHLAYGARLPGHEQALLALPTASALLRLAPALLAAGAAVPPAQALPHYLRDKVAQTSAERDAARQQNATPAASAQPDSTPAPRQG